MGPEPAGKQAMESRGEDLAVQSSSCIHSWWFGSSCIPRGEAFLPSSAHLLFSLIAVELGALALEDLTSRIEELGGEGV